MKIAYFKPQDWERAEVEKVFSGEVDFIDGPLDADNLPEKKDYEIICVFVGSKIDEAVMKAFPNLKLIVTRSTGFDHIDLLAAEKLGLQVANVPTYGENTVAEFALALILTLSRKIYPAYDRLREKGVYSFEGLEGFDLKERTLGVIGTGNIGRHVIRMAKGFQMKVIAFDTWPKKELVEELGFEYKKSLEEVLGEADITTLHVPYMSETHHMINRDNVGSFKKGAILINTARGALVETDALLSALRSGQLGGAGLDVLEEEGVMKDELGYLLEGDGKSDLKVVLENHELIDMDNVIITPHNAFNTREAKTRILKTTIENVQSFTKSGESKNKIVINKQ